MKIYTKRGDLGDTSLLGGEKTSKADMRVCAYGEVDELNAYIGLLKDQQVNQDRVIMLESIQNKLFTIGSMLALGEGAGEKIKITTLTKEDVLPLEQHIDMMEATLPPLTTFVLPGGHKAVSIGHIARTVCRRAERAVVARKGDAVKAQLIVQYLNRLSDYLFVLCRKMAHQLNIKETPWKPST